MIMKQVYETAHLAHEVEGKERWMKFNVDYTKKGLLLEISL